MKWYQTQFNEISEVEVERESESSVWIGGQRRGKITDWRSYFKTREEAKAHIVNGCKAGVEYAERQLKHQQEKLAKAEAL